MDARRGHPSEPSAHLLQLGGTSTLPTSRVPCPIGDRSLAPFEPRLKIKKTKQPEATATTTIEMTIKIQPALIRNKGTRETRARFFSDSNCPKSSENFLRLNGGDRRDGDDCVVGVCSLGCVRCRESKKPF